MWLKHNKMGQDIVMYRVLECLFKYARGGFFNYDT